METELKKGRRTPFFFIPLPRFAFGQNIFQDHEYFRFICFAFNKTAFESMVILHCGQRIDLDPLEFIFGRGFWAQELGFKERKVRTFICQLTGHKLASKVANKSASKFTVYKWLWEHFPGNLCQQGSQQEAGKAPPEQPAIIMNKNKNKEKEQQQQIAAAACPFVGKAKRLFLELPEEERAAVIALFYKRSKNQPVGNAEAWFVKCIEEKWHLEEKLEVPLEQAPEPSDFEKNKVLAKEAMQEFEGLIGSEIYLRSDFLEIKLRGQRCQIFYAEPSPFFGSKLNFAVEELRKV